MVRPVSKVTFAIILFLLAILLFDLMGLIIKRLSSDYRAAELSAYRNIFGLVPSVLALWTSSAWRARGRPVIIRQTPLAIARGLLATGAQLLYYLALARIAFATTTTIAQSHALFMTALAVPLLGERVGPVRWFAVIVGFAGVIMIIGIGPDAFSKDALLPLAAAAVYALNAVTARMFDDDVPTPLFNLYAAVAAVVGSLIYALATGGFSAFAAQADIAWIIAMGCFGGTAVLVLTVATRMAEQSTLAPLTFFGIPLGFGLGWLFFDEAPIGDLFPGALFIAAGGLAIIWRERRLAQQQDRGSGR